MPLCNKCRSLSEGMNEEEEQAGECDRCDRKIETIETNPKKKSFWCKIGWHCGHYIGEESDPISHGKHYVKRIWWDIYECCKCDLRWEKRLWGYR